MSTSIQTRDATQCTLGQRVHCPQSDRLTLTESRAGIDLADIMSMPAGRYMSSTRLRAGYEERLVAQPFHRLLTSRLEGDSQSRAYGIWRKMLGVAEADVMAARLTRMTKLDLRKHKSTECHEEIVAKCRTLTKAPGLLAIVANV